MNEPFKALVARKESDNISLAVENMSIDDLSPGEVVVKVAYSSVNYKDGLACDPKSRVARSYPLIPGIDLTGTVMQSEDGRFRAGDEVLVTGYGLGVSHSGGFSELARVPADWIVPVPAGLTMRECMIIGTAGFTAALSVQKLQLNGLTPEQGPVLVTGATGGVGSMAVSILAKLGYSVTASTGKEAEHDYLKGLGASEVIGRDEWIDASDKPLLKEKWAGTVDPVGGRTLVNALRMTKYGGAAASSGLTGGTELMATVYPFILRGVNLLGVDSVLCPMDVRKQIWKLLSEEWKPAAALEELSQEVELKELPEVLSAILKGQVRGRTVLKL